MNNVFESHPEFRHLLDVLLGAQTSLTTIMNEAKKRNDPSALRIALAEAETVSKSAVRLSSGLSAIELSNPGTMKRNDVPTSPDTEVDKRAKVFLSKMEPIFAYLKADLHSRRVTNLRDGTVSEADYVREGGPVRTPAGEIIPQLDYLEIIKDVRDLTEAEQHDYNQFTRKRYQ